MFRAKVIVGYPTSQNKHSRKLITIIRISPQGRAKFDIILSKYYVQTLKTTDLCFRELQIWSTKISRHQLNLGFAEIPNNCHQQRARPPESCSIAAVSSIPKAWDYETAVH
jgi:hypothetical protein